jgi:hypothetical protein
MVLEGQVVDEILPDEDSDTQVAVIAVPAVPYSSGSVMITSEYGASWK